MWGWLMPLYAASKMLIIYLDRSCAGKQKARILIDHHKPRSIELSRPPKELNSWKERFDDQRIPATMLNSTSTSMDECIDLTCCVATIFVNNNLIRRRLCVSRVFGCQSFLDSVSCTGRQQVSDWCDSLQQTEVLFSSLDNTMLLMANAICCTETWFWRKWQIKFNTFAM